MDFGLNEVAKTRPAAIWAIFLTLEIRRGQNELDIGVVGDHTKGRKKVCEIYQLLEINYVLDLQIQRIMLAYAFFAGFQPRQPQRPNCNTLRISYRQLSTRGMPDQPCSMRELCTLVTVRFARDLVSMRLSREQRRALKMLADAPRGVSEEVLVIAHGFSAETLGGLVLAGLAMVVTETKTVLRGLTIDIERIRITTEGRQAIEG
jgi:hypothetical protein